MKLHELSDNAGAHKARMRIGRGIGSGKGKTGGRGGKGQTARSGVRIKGFEGGQMPLHRRLPKRGFDNSPFALKLNEINLGRLQAAIDAGKLDAKSTINAEAMVKAGVMRRARAGVRLLGTGELKAKINIEVYGASKSAQAAVEKAGGSVKILAPKKEPSEPKGKNALAALGKGKSKTKAAEGKAAEGKAAEGKAAEGKAAEGKAAEGKAAEGEPGGTAA